MIFGEGPKTICTKLLGGLVCAAVIALPVVGGALLVGGVMKHTAERVADDVAADVVTKITPELEREFTRAISDRVRVELRPFQSAELVSAIGFGAAFPAPAGCAVVGTLVGFDTSLEKVIAAHAPDKPELAALFRSAISVISLFSSAPPKKAPEPARPDQP